MRNRFMKFSASVLGVAAMASVLSCTTQQQESPMKAKVEEYAQVELKSDLVNGLNDKEKELVKIFFQVGEVTDDLFWKQTFGDKSVLDTLTDSYAKKFAMIQYGAWDRLDNNKPSFRDTARNWMSAIITRTILRPRSLMPWKMRTRIHGIPLSVEMQTVL